MGGWGRQKNTPSKIHQDQQDHQGKIPCFFFPPLESMNCAEPCTKPDWFAVLQNSAKIKAYWEQCGGWKFLISNCSPFQFEQNLLQNQKNPNNKYDYVYSLSANYSVIGK